MLRESVATAVNIITLWALPPLKPSPQQVSSGQADPCEECGSHMCSQQIELTGLQTDGRWWTAAESAPARSRRTCSRSMHVAQQQHAGPLVQVNESQYEGKWCDSLLFSPYPWLLLGCIKR